MSTHYELCIHESAHIVAAGTLGARIACAKIDKRGGCVTAQGLRDWRDKVVYGLAGEVGEAKAGARALNFSTPSLEEDRAVVRAAFEHWLGAGKCPENLGAHPAFQRELQRTRLLVTERWEQITMLANRLENFGAVFVADFRALIEPALPPLMTYTNTEQLIEAKAALERWDHWAFENPDADYSKTFELARSIQEQLDANSVDRLKIIDAQILSTNLAR